MARRAQVGDRPSQNGGRSIEAMGWVDTHCHLQLDERSPAELLARAGHVDWVVVPGVDAESSQSAADLAASNPTRMVHTAGLHPHDAVRWPLEREQIRELARGAVAVGETGLDFYRNLSPPELQRQAFADQIELALELSLPVVVHCRDAFADVYSHIEAAGVGAATVLHCWTGGPRWTKRFLELGCTFSFAGPVAFETGDTVRLGAALVPPERALVETDTPFLAPPPHRHEQNEPAWVELVGVALARVWSMSVAEVQRITADNAARVFRR
jgi:TatD DNase family protein